MRKPALNPAPKPAHIVKIGKAADKSICNLSISVSNRYPYDIEGNYLDIALINKSGAIIGRKNGYFHQHIFQSGYTTTFSLATALGCDDVSGIKIYAMAFEMPGGLRFQGYNAYELKLDGF